MSWMRLSAAFVSCAACLCMTASAPVAGSQQGTPATQQKDDGTRKPQGAAQGTPAQGGAGQQGSAGQSGGGQSGTAQTGASQNPQGPTFRGGIDFVRVDVIVSDKKQQPVTNLTQEDFEILEDGKPQKVEQFRLVLVDGNPKPGEPAPREIRNQDDIEREAAREDVRLWVLFLDDYHTRLSNSMTVRTPLTRFLQTLRPNDLVAIMYPLQPVTDLSFTRNHDLIARALDKFEGRKFDYRPRNQLEENYVRYSTDQVETIRNQVVMSALRGLATHLGALNERRKSVVFVSEGFTAMLPPQMRRMDASRPADPIETAVAAGQQDTPREQTAEWFGQTDVYSQMRDIFDAANRNNTAFYSLDPRGLAPFEYGFDDLPSGPPPSFATDRRALQMTQDTLRSLSEETDGRAIVNRNTLEQGLAQMVRDSTAYYLLGYTTTQAATDGKFHKLEVRVKRRDVEVRSRKGFWALTPADVERVKNPTPEVAKPVQTALASISTNVQAGKYVRTWIGTEKGSNGKTRVTLVWEPLPPSPGSARREQAGRVSLLAATQSGDLVFRGRAPDAALAAAAPPSAPNDTGPVSARAPAAAAASAPQRLVFDSPPGKIELRMTVEAAGSGGTLDQEIRDLSVPDFTAPQAALSTPRIYRARTAREFTAMVGDAAIVPIANREFSRTERLLIRFDAYGVGTERPEPTAALLNNSGKKMSDVPVAAGTGGSSHQIDLSLASIPPGEYLVEITVKGSDVKELVPLRVTS
ncbi:MAG TPA: VWA domain-containing protein [Vicinamibacterales bacterium]|nr:VWA domain-containing protein [Vicinamibacterales bacterium]